MSNRIRLSAKTTACVALLSISTAGMAEQQLLPATQHQADVIETAKQKRAQTPEMEMGMSVSEHQRQVMRQFEEADANRDGNLTKEEYSAYTIRNTAARYSSDLAKPEKPGVDAAGSRDRHAADNTNHPIPSGEPTMTD